MLESHLGSKDVQFLVPLFNFVLCGDRELECNSLSCTLPPIKFDYESSADASDSPKEGSSFDSFKRLRLLMSLLIEPSAIKTMAASEEFCKKLVETLELGLGHPYKQLREEVARGPAKVQGLNICLNIQFISLESHRLFVHHQV